MKRLFAVSLLLLTSLAAEALTIEQYHPHDFIFKAAPPANPFDVELTAEFSFAGTNGARLTVPGFYDGDGVWKIRFSPPKQGEWSMRTTSSLESLNGKKETNIICVPNRHPNIHGGLRVDPAHPHHFVYEDGTRYFLLGYEADWLWAPEMTNSERKVMHRLIDQMASRGFNHVLVNVYAHDTRWATNNSSEWDFGPAEIYPWEGNNLKPDHARLNPKFFQLYDGMMNALQDKGIVAHIMIKVYNKRVKWPTRWSRDEERFFRYVVARYQAYANVVWDYSKESFNEKDNHLQAKLVDLIRQNDAYKRLVTVHDDEAYEWDSELSGNVDFRTDQQHSDYAAAIKFDRARRKYPIVNAEFGYEYGVDKLLTHDHGNQCVWQEQLRRAYHVYLSGGYGVYYYNNTAWDVIKPDPEAPGMKPFQLLKDSLSALPYWRMNPADELAIGGLCLALPGEAYAFYVEGDSLTANLTGLISGTVKAEWINTWTGEKEKAVARPGLHKLKKPESFGTTPGLLIVRVTSPSVTP